jgi:hypothetical protein
MAERHPSRWLLPLLLCCLCTVPFGAARAGSNAAQAEKAVVVQGVGASTDPAKARDDALADAQRRAVEVGVGLYLKSETVVENLAVLTDSIYTHTEGYIASYEVLSERVTGEERRVEIRALVRMGKLENDLAVLWEKLQLASSPRVIVAIEQPQPTDVEGLVQSVVTEKLVGYGFRVLDASQLSEAKRRRLVRLLRSEGRQTAEALALQDDADIVVIGNATRRPLGKPVPELDAYSAEAALDARAVRTDTAKVVAASRGSSGPTAGFRQDQAAEAALRAAAEDWVKRNLGALVRASRDPTSNYSIVVIGGDYQTAQALTSLLAESRFVRDASLRAYDEGTAQIEVRFVGSGKALANEVASLDSPRVAVKGLAARTLTVKVEQ